MRWRFSLPLIASLILGAGLISSYRVYLPDANAPTVSDDATECGTCTARHQSLAKVRQALDN